MWSYAAAASRWIERDAVGRNDRSVINYRGIVDEEQAGAALADAPQALSDRTAKRGGL